ncbi:MAG: HEAT repeat domain-containing protein [Anaerolineales bacterium]|nr:HEAT repeat domain-containing protein [Anaerolineales bacterium]
MGYSTSFSGAFVVANGLAEAHANYLAHFAGVYHVKRDVALLLHYPDPIREAARLPVGDDGAYFIGFESLPLRKLANAYGIEIDETHQYGQTVFDRALVTEAKTHPDGQPSYWCHWIPSFDRQSIIWNGAEKFQAYREWLRYLLERFLIPWGYSLSGTVAWQGEAEGDFGKLILSNSQLIVEANHHQEPEPRRIIQACLEELDNTNAGKRYAAIKSLGRYAVFYQHGYAAEFSGALAQFLKDTDPKARQLAAQQLHYLGKSASHAFNELIIALQDVHPWVRAEAAYALGAMGEHAVSAIPHIKILLTDSESGPRYRAKQMLDMIENDRGAGT